MIKSQEAIIDVQADTVAVARRVANWLIERLAENKSRFSLCLSGGHTPKLLYETLAKSESVSKISWSKVHIFWGDERFVPQNRSIEQLQNG